MKILIVDDNRVNRVQLKALLTSYGNCDEASNGDEAIMKFNEAHDSQKPYSLITMDIDLDGEDGKTVVERIRHWEDKNEIYKQNLETKILMVTVKDSKDDVFTSFHKGCEGYLVKPVTPEKLEEVLKSIDLI